MNDLRPAIRFLLVFIGAYLVLNILYGVWIHSSGTRPDAMTWWVGRQTAYINNLAGNACVAKENPAAPTVFLGNGTDRPIVSVFEGCNGLNVMIVFLAFILAFGGPVKRMIWFIPVGLIIIHLSNLVRLIFLYYLAQGKSHYFYYFHKYFFTAGIYLIVFGLWWVWVRFLNQKHVEAS